MKEESKKEYKKIIDKFKSQGVQGVILGCTEIPLLIKPEDSSIEIFDTTMIHAKAAVEFALKDVRIFIILLVYNNNKGRWLYGDSI